MNIWDKVKEYAPTVATALATGGASLPLAAVQILSKELFGTEAANQNDIAGELGRLTDLANNGDPKAAAKLRKLEITHTETMAELKYESINDARKRDIAIQNKRGKNKRADYMILLAFIGFCGCLGTLIFLFLFNDEAPDPGLVAVVATFGTKFLGMIDLSFAFEFGGSADGEKANKNIQDLLTSKLTGKSQ